MKSSVVKFGIVVFPGSNCDYDCFYVLKKILKQEVRFLWHKHSSIEDVDVIVLPGGFSYGDYLRCGAIARFSPIMKSVIEFAGKGGTVLGICNGFQILCESGLLPGALLRNKSLKFICDYVNIRVENNKTIYTSAYKQGEVLKIPIAHGDGNYFADDDTIKMLEDNGQVLFRYCEPDGRVTPNANPNGAVNNIAGIINESGSIMGMMPHPERASDAVLRHTDGRRLFESIINERLLKCLET
ncbi:MAG: phosphoribosylformylglycinamidine synthase subunit PurQ [Bacteroidetes bacterium]|nr:phosphoribosylformylglycinamidine synthase subunit PurQ [Bacteroidota bacterium]MBU1423509.1 phosphoribosylformylglycinamidine synthase subunit PurQ [Bacteroidota bacterium]MBU2636709.1 phosphoribosylformylglycinamidine synthase subunit PurQ [Bacteroidota bacterium]